VIKTVTWDCSDALRLARFWATLGATVVRRGDALVVMCDPEGNEFCVEPGPA
jgi:Glyoxalase-like domain